MKSDRRPDVIIVLVEQPSLPVTLALLRRR